MPSVSVIITSHSRPNLLPRAVESARAAGSDVEVLVVDDASRDETAEVCRHLKGIRYVRVERNRKVAGARNVGILNSKGDFLTFLDDDDVRLAGVLDLQVEALARAPEAGLIYAQALMADAKGVQTGDFYPSHCPQGDVFWELLGRNFIPCGTAVFRRSCLFRTGLLDQSVPGIDDWDMWIRISALYPVMALEQPALVWRKSSPASGQGTSNASELARCATRQLRRKWLKLPRAAAATAAAAADALSEKRSEARRRFSRNMAAHLAFETARALGERQFLRAQANGLAALRLHPWGCLSAAASSSTLHFLWESVKGKRSRKVVSAHLTGRRPDEIKR